MRRVVIDTNVLVSAILSPKGAPAKVMDYVSSRELELYFSPEIIDEYQRVLAYKKLKIEPETQESIIASLINLGIMLVPQVSKMPMSDESDRVFYDTVKSSNAFLVTGNSKHYPAESFVVAPVDFLAMMVQWVPSN